MQEYTDFILMKGWANSMVKIKVSYMTNKSYPSWKAVLKDLIIDEKDGDNPYKIEDEIKEQHNLADGEYISELEWDYTKAERIDD